MSRPPVLCQQEARKQIASWLTLLRFGLGLKSPRSGKSPWAKVTYFFEAST